jgi:Domain of unknown function (DUF4157)/Novel toxin 15
MSGDGGGYRHRPPSPSADPAKGAQGDDPKFAGRSSVEEDREWARRRIANHLAGNAIARSEKQAQPVQRKPKDAGDWRERIAKGRGQTQSGGAPLAGDVRGRMEPQLGADLSGVKVHTDGAAAQAADGFGARAFTVGSDVHFNAGEYAPGTRQGDELIAHELAHVVQGQRSGVQRKAAAPGGAGEHQAEGAEDEGAEHQAEGEEKVSQPGDPAEQEADGVAAKAADELHGKGDEGAEGDDEKKQGGDDEKKQGGEKPSQEAPAIAAKLMPGAVQLAKKGATAQPAKPATTTPGAPAKAKAKAEAVPFDMSGKPHTLEAAPAADGAKLTVNKAPIAGKVRQALETAEVKAAQGDKKGKATGPTEIVALREVLTQIEALGTQKNITPEQLKTQTHAIADKLTQIAILTGWKSLDDAGQTLAHAKKPMAPVELTAWNCEPVYDFAEYKRQIKDQEDGVNSMVAARWATERPRYVKEGRSDDAKRAQKNFRLRTGIKGDKSKAAPHAPDGIAAGHPDPTGKPADSAINSSIGAQWGDAGRAPKVDKAVEALPEPEKATTQMNVKMSVEKAA